MRRLFDGRTVIADSRPPFNLIKAAEDGVEFEALVAASAFRGCHGVGGLGRERDKQSEGW